jgi:hypothetical protein
VVRQREELFCPRFLPEGLVKIASKLPAVMKVIDSVARHHAADIRVKLSSVLVLVRVSDNELYNQQIEVPFQMGEHEGIIKVSRVRFERFAKAGTVPALTVSSLEKLAVRSSGIKRTADDMVQHAHSIVSLHTNLTNALSLSAVSYAFVSSHVRRLAKLRRGRLQSPDLLERRRRSAALRRQRGTSRRPSWVNSYDSP